MNLLQFCQSSSDNPKMVEAASQAFDSLFDISTQLNHDESLYEYLKETRKMEGDGVEQTALNSLIVHLDVEINA